MLRGDGAAGGAWRSKVFLGSDNHPTSFSDMMDVSSRYGVTSGKVTFTGDEATSSKGKRVSNEGTRRALGGWKPQYDSFAAFAQAGGDDFYSQSGLY